MNGRPHLGEFELLVIAAIVRLGTQSYGMRIRQEIAEKTEREVSVGSLYKTLKRLENKGLISSRKGDATAVRGGRAKTYFAANADGVAALRLSIRNLERLLDGADIDLSPA